MPKKFEDMVSGIWNSIKGKVNPRTKKPFTESDAYAMATTRWKAMGHKAPTREKLEDWHIIEFFVPIQETSSIGKDFIIKGIAINETTTRNGIKYIAKELELAAPSFKGKKILLDHKNEAMNIVGVIRNSLWNVNKKAIEFEAQIMDEAIKERINDGRISDVSIGAKVQDLVSNKDTKEVTAIGIEGLEISLVAVPGDPGANIGQALEHSFQLKEKFEDDIDVDEEPVEEPIEDEPKEEPVEEQTITCPGCGMKYDMDEKKWSGKGKERLNDLIVLKIN